MSPLSNRNSEISLKVSKTLSFDINYSFSLRLVI
jgi:hypothetical protein